MSNEYKIIKRLIPENDNLNYSTKNPRTRRFIDILITKDGQKEYVPNFRGLLLYLYNEFLTSKNAPDIYTRGSRLRRSLRKRTIHRNIHLNQKIAKNIRSVVTNPRIIRIAPFLQYCSEFETYGFKLIELLLEISIELQNQLHIDAYDDTYLLRRATERYILALENFFFEHGLFLAEGHETLEGLMINYRKFILPLIRHLISKEVDRLEFFQDDVDKSQVLQQLDGIVSGGGIQIIPIKIIVSGYVNSITNSILEMIKIKRDYNDYLLTDSFLISKRLLRKVGSQFSDKIGYQEATLILERKNIPKQCTSDVMNFLGYKEIRGRLLKDDDLDTGRHITFERIKTA